MPSFHEPAHVPADARAHHDPAADSTADLSALRRHIVVASEVCGVFLGYPTFLVWAQVETTVPANLSDLPKKDAPLRFVLGDGTTVCMDQVALNKTFLNTRKRQLATTRLIKAARKSTGPLALPSLSVHAQEATTAGDIVLGCVPSDARQIPEKHLASLASRYALTYEQLGLRSLTTRSRRPLAKERKACSYATRRLEEEYGVGVGWKDVFKALVALGVSAAAERRVKGGKETFWCTDDFVMGYGKFKEHVKTQRLAVLPDPADFMTASVVDTANKTGSVQAFMEPAKSVALTRAVFAHTPALAGCLSG